MKTDKCWATCLGNCNGHLSREHTISKSLWASPYVEVSGFVWCKGLTKRIGLESLTTRALCVKHNNDLSPLDALGAHAFDILRQQTKLTNERSKEPHKKFRRVDFQINATALERWLLKTLINLSYEGPYFIGPKSTSQGFPSEDLVRVVYGKLKMPRENGLFVAAKPGMDLEFTDTVQMSPLVKDEKHIHGGLFRFRGVYMFLDLVPGGLKVPFEQMPNTRAEWHFVRLQKPFKQIKATLGDRVSHVVNFNWS